MRSGRRFLGQLARTGSDENFLRFLGGLETFVAKALSVAMIVIILFAIVDLGYTLVRDISAHPLEIVGKELLELFGLVLNVLIALEILENITAYLKKHVIQAELVIVTSLTSLARKIITLEFERIGSAELISVAVAVLALAIGYWIVHQVNRK